MGNEIVVKGLDGSVRARVHGRAGGLPPSWSDVFDHLSGSGAPTTGLDLRNLKVDGRFNATGLDLGGSDFSASTIERGILVDCCLDGCRFHRTRFHHARRSGVEGDTSVGMAFLRCSFSGATLIGCDFVMSSLISCRFGGSAVIGCDFRNVVWFDHMVHRAREWMALDGVPDPFVGARLEGCRFGHPMGNILSLPKQMMIPPSFGTVWAHMGDAARAWTRFAYLFSETPDRRFESRI